MLGQVDGATSRRRYASFPLAVIHTLGRGVGRTLRRGLVVSALVLLGLFSMPTGGSSQPAVSSDPVTRVRVDRFVVTGVSVFPEDQIQALLASGKGQELTLAEIEGLAARITALYREHGYILARAYVPAQEMREGAVEIAVVDSGRGISAAHRAHIFEPFFSTKEPGRGTGLGLFISAEIVREHKGRIDIDSEEGRGSTFRVFLPGVESGREKSRAPRTSSSTRTRIGSSPGRSTPTTTARPRPATSALASRSISTTPWAWVMCWRSEGSRQPSGGPSGWCGSPTPFP